jgi:hypothetical protein
VRPAAKALLAFILIFLAWTALAAQSSPQRLGGRLLLLPDDWPKDYDPPEVLIQVKVNPDSTLLLLDILDGKDELGPLLEQFLLTYQYQPVSDSLAIGTQIEAVVEIAPRAVREAEQVQPDRAELLQNMEKWITETREATNFHTPLRDPVDYTGLNHTPEPYRSGFFFYRRPGGNAPTLLNGFTPQTNIYSGDMFDDLSLGVLTGRSDPLALSYNDSVYPYEAALSDIEVGIGDYEHLFARGSVKKNKLFGIDRLYLGFDFLTQSGNWLEKDSNRNILKLALRAPLGKTTIDLGFAEYSSELQSVTLRPEYWTENFIIQRNYRVASAIWRSPWLDLALLNENDTSRSDVFLATLHNDALHLRASKALRLKSLTVAALYERKLTDRDFDLAGNDYTDLASLDLDLDSSSVKASANARLYDFSRLDVSSSLRVLLSNFTLGLQGRSNDSYLEPRTWVSSIYNAADSLSRVDIRENSNYGVFLGWQPWDDSRVSLSAGVKDVQNLYNPGFVKFAEPISQHASVYYTRLGADINGSWSQWRIGITPGITWQTGYSFLFEEPALEYQANVNLTRLLSYGNALFAGFSILGHSGYSCADQYYIYLDSSVIADIWAGVRISNRFEFQVTYKNLTDSTIYGVYPLPASIHASLRWFFLN